MATILYYSDIHIEIREKEGGTGWTSRYPLALGPDLRAHAGRAALLVLAGDIGRMRSRRNVSTLAYAAQAAECLGCPALVVPGNHEYYRGSFDEEREALLAARLEGVTAIDRGEVHFPIDGRMLRVLGATLWTDYAANGDFFEAMRRAQDTIEDHRLISRRGGASFTPQDALEEHRLSRAWLAERLAEPHAGPTLVVTHHVPHSAACNSKFGITPLSPAFHSDCDELIHAAARAKVAAWIFGHHHWCHELDCGAYACSRRRQGTRARRPVGSARACWTSEARLFVRARPLYTRWALAMAMPSRFCSRISVCVCYIYEGTSDIQRGDRPRAGVVALALH